MADRDITRLPNWAQDMIHTKDREIERLQNDIRELREQDAPDLENAVIIVDPHSETRRRALPAGTDFHFRHGSMVLMVEFDAETGTMEVSGSGSWSSLAILPWTTNAVRIQHARHGERLAVELNRQAREHEQEANAFTGTENERDYRAGHSGFARGLRAAAATARKVLG